jgi:hypothetical protein
MAGWDEKEPRKEKGWCPEPLQWVIFGEKYKIQVHNAYYAL